MVKRRERNKRRFSFFNTLFFAIIPIIIIGMLVVKSIYVYETIVIVDYKDLENMLLNNNILDITIGLIGIAISVWLGINIVNLLDRKQVDELNNGLNRLIEQLAEEEKKIKELESKIHSTNINIENQFYKMKFLDELLKTIDLYESSWYLYNLFNSNIEVDYQILYRIESEYWLCTNSYENVEWKDSYKYSKRGLALLTGIEDVQMCKEYYFLRKSDFLFYKNIVLTHDRSLDDFSILELKESIKLYERIIDKFNEKESNIEQKYFIGFLYNTVGYTYDIMHVHSDDNEEKNYYLSMSIYNMNVAIQYNDKGRYYRNLGLAYQHSGNVNKAKECYQKAFEKDPKDYKAYNNRLAIILRELDSKIEVNSRFDNNFSLAEIKNVNSEMYALYKELREVSKYREFAERANCWFEDIYFNICKMYMYFYIFSNYRKKRYIEMSIEYGKKALFLNGKSLGAKFCLRNAYECYDKIEEAKKINTELMSENNGDSIKANDFYNKRIEKIANTNLAD